MKRPVRLQRFTAPTLAILGFLVLTAFAVAPTRLELGFPLACKLNESCWIVNYFDQDPSQGVLDFGCGHRTYNGHTGVDIGIGNIKKMEQGVSVFAAADGIVKGTRSHLPDISIRQANATSILGKECGNGVLIDHGQGWATQYCHMKQGSIKVKIGESVKTGQTLGQVGLSGSTEFPHLHISVYNNQQQVDPFTAMPASGQCSPNVQSLWKTPVPYQSVIIGNMTASEAIHASPTILNGLPENGRLTRNSPFLVIWLEAYGIEPGDLLIVQLFDPDNRLISNQKLTLTQRKAWKTFQLTKRRPAPGWQSGSYKGTATIYRKSGNISAEKQITFSVR